ncbi:unnamed protein product [Acanthoscelides obtectus]|uniref:HTH psq-type domain-containing protein n=1 Tax=Acanthoscelides obtectus TaxID=200917 RepID=A0A9P0JJY7_ACAOB|nr:unnamed protein product [Acanthoscelides obtectus]CAK1658049.1 Protein distal antenna [Acanthoscelides obtectus]
MSVVKTSKQSLTAQEKWDAILRVNAGETKASVARDIGVPESTLRGWCRNEDKISYLCRRSSSDVNDAVNDHTIFKRAKTEDQPLDQRLRSNGNHSAEPGTSVNTPPSGINESDAFYWQLAYFNMLTHWNMYSYMTTQASQLFPEPVQVSVQHNAEGKLTKSEAVEHGEKFLQWLETCNDPSVTDVQIMQLKKFLNNVKSGANRKNEHLHAETKVETQ